MFKSAKKYLVETISITRTKYYIEADRFQDANAEVVNSLTKNKEFSKISMHEMITSTREISDKEYIKIFDQDNPELSKIEKKVKLEFIHKRTLFPARSKKTLYIF